jgi:hypothetical protein
MDFIHFDCSGNSVALAAATGQKSEHANRDGEEETHLKLRDIMRRKH